MTLVCIIIAHIANTLLCLLVFAHHNVLCVNLIYIHWCRDRFTASVYARVVDTFGQYGRGELVPMHAVGELALIPARQQHRRQIVARHMPLV